MKKVLILFTFLITSIGISQDDDYTSGLNWITDLEEAQAFKKTNFSLIYRKRLVCTM